MSARLVARGNAQTLVIGRTLQFTACGTYSDGSVAVIPDSEANPIIAWNTSNHKVAKISLLGHFMAVGTGTTNIEGVIGTITATPWTLTVLAAAAPSSPSTVSCLANPSIMNQSSIATITAAGVSPQGLPLTYSYSTSAGLISGNSTTATLTTSGASAGIITVTCTVDQQGGGSASATTSVLLQSVTGEQALTNFQFTDSVGVNLHLSYLGTVFTTNFPQIMQSMITLGVSHYRDGLSENAPSLQYENARLVGQGGNKG